MREEVRARLSRGRYLVPNAVTLGNMFCGFLTIIYASSGRFEKACLAIAIAILLDGLDGRVARKLNATSKFGLEFDSFSDLVSFGVAPAILLYHWCFVASADEFGVIVTFLYVMGAASRLARFNISTPGLTNFEGMPTPGAAAMMAALVNFMPRIEPSASLIVFGSSLMVFISYLMVSRLEFYSIKRLKFAGMNNITRIFIGVIIALIWYRSDLGFLILSSCYCLSGPLALLKRKPKTLEVSSKNGALNEPQKPNLMQVK